MSQIEAVRLIIWDLDDTFWHGTVTEGGHLYSRKAHDVVVALTERGILNSICSKNDAQVIEGILREEKIWDYFVFPSINWLPKGNRIAAIIEMVKLRPETILFIDDNPLNRAEAAHVCPGLQIADETIVPTLLDDPRFVGKPDTALSRLKQYKVLEQKYSDSLETGGDNVAFLQGSGIKVFVDHDVESSIDRAVELINRTNQLNFTKIRLSDDLAVARVELLGQLRSYLVHAGLIYATDRYGDYGCIGLYVMERGGRIGRRLVHFCFSCRTLGMDIETWMFNRLGSPDMVVRGEVLTNVKDKTKTVDWITEVHSKAELMQEATQHEQLDTLVIRGGCDVRAIMHYVEGMFQKKSEEVNDVVDGLAVRSDHCIFLHYALNGIEPEAIAALAPFGFRPIHFESAISMFKSGEKNAIIVSFWLDPTFNLYRHRDTGVLVPLIFPGFGVNLLEKSYEELEGRLKDVASLRAVAHLRAEFDYVGAIDGAYYKSIIADLIQRTPRDTLIVFIQVPQYWYRDNTDVKFTLNKPSQFRELTVEVSKSYPNVAVLDPHDFAQSRSEYLDLFHFTRPVYQRIGLEVFNTVQRFNSSADIVLNDKPVIIKQPE